MYEELLSKMANRKAIYPKGYRPLSLREKVLSLVVEANKNAPIERRVIPRSALTVMNRANASLSSLSNESRELGVLREVAKFITAHQDTFKAYEYSSNTDLLPIGHPRSSLNLTASSDVARERYAQWLSSDPSIDNSIRPLIATAHSLEPGSIERRHAFARLRVTLASAIPLFFKIDESPIKTLLAAFGFGGGNSSAARRARVALQWRDRRGRWVEMGRGIDFNFRFPNGDIGSAGGTYVGVNAARGYSTENGKPVANAGLVEIRGDNSLPDGIYSIESANATPIKARIPGKALKRAGVKRDTGARKPTAKESSSANIPNLEDLLKTRVDAPSGWRKQNELEKAQDGDDGSFISDDDYKAIPTESGFALHRLDQNGKTGQKVADARSWAEVQAAAEKDSDDYEKFKATIGVRQSKDDYKVKMDLSPDSGDGSGLLDDIGAREQVDAFIGANNLDGRVSVKSIDGSDVIFNIPDDAKEDFARANGYEDWKSQAAEIEQVDVESENRKGIDDARAAKQERLAESIFSRRMEGESLEEVAEDLNMTREQVRKIEADYARQNPDKARRKESTEGVGESGALPNGVNYTAESKKIPVGVFPGREPGNVDGVQVKLSGNTYPQRELIKKLGFKWNNAEKTWNKNFFESTLFGHQNSVDAIKEQLDGVGGGEVPRFAGDNNEIAAIIQEAYNEVLEHGRSGDIPNETASNRYYDAREALKDANVGFGNSLKNDIPNNQDDRKNARSAIESFFDEVERPGFPGGPRMEKAKDLLGKAIDMLDEKIKAAEPDFKLTLPSPASKPKEKPTAFTGIDNVEDWSNETVNLYNVQDLINGGELNDSDAVKLEDALDRAYSPLTDAREYTDSGSGPLAGSWTDLDNPPAEVIKAIKQALSPLEELKDRLDEIDTGDDKDNSLDRDIEEAKEQVDDLIKELKSKLAKWKESTATKEEEEEEDSEDEPRATAFTGIDNIEDWSNESVNLYEVEDLLNNSFDDLDNASSVKKHYDDAMKSLNDARKLVLSDEWTDLNLPPDEAVSHLKEAVPDLEKLEDSLLRQGMPGGEKETEVEFEAAAQQVRGLIDELNKRINAWDDGAVPPSPPSRYTGPFSSSGEFGKDITDTVVDGAESEFDMPKELEQVLDDDAAEVGEGIVEQMWDAADSRFDIQDQFNNNFSYGMDKEEFIQAAVDSLGDQLSAILEAAYIERRDLEDDEDLEIDFDEKSFMESAKKKYRELLSDTWDAREEDSDDEPPTPPSDGGGGTPPKVPSPSTPSTPALFNEFDAPAGAFKLRTIDYEPDGRVDEESTDFTDDPERLAVKYTLPQLSVALTQALIGDRDDAIFNEIIESSIGDDGELLDLEEIDDVVDSPSPAAGRANGSGAGQLEFNKGDEFVPAEALYNAIFLAGGDPNRVIANAYDAVNGNRNNLNKLHDAAGGTPDPDEEALIDDIFEEISQIKEASTPKETEEKAANASDEQRDDAPQGELLYNIPVDTEKNPDYYDIDTNSYSPLTEEPDENGYSDNPRYIATKFEEADLLEQFEKAIVNGSGSALLNFNPDAPSNEGLYEVRVEAVRDALQRLNVNTNAVIERILSESNDFEEAPEPAQTPEPARVANMFNENVDAIKDFYDVDDDLFPSGVNVISYLPSDGSLAYVDPWEDLYVARNGSITQVTVSPEWFSDPRGAGQAGWRDLTPQERASIYDTSSEPEEDETETSEPAPVTPQYQYPGPEEAGYSPNNTTVVRDGVVVGKGARVQAVKDGKLGTVTAIQNNPEYLRIKFDDGTTQVRSASKVRAISTDSGGASTVVTREEMLPSTDVQQRLDRPLLPAPRIARSGDTIGVNDESTRPDFLEGKTREDSVQSNFSEWRDRDAEVAKAGKDRVSLDVLEQLAYKYSLADQDGSAREVNEIKDEIKRLIGDAYGDRSGISFGGDFYTLKVRDVSIDVDLENSYNNPSKQDMDNGKASVAFGISLDIRDVNGRPIGRAKRSIKIKRKLDRDGNVIEVSKSGYAEFMALYNKELKQKGFGSAYNRWVENWYAANGIEKVYVGAAGGGEYQGGFVWALTGYNWTNSTDVVNIMQKLRRQARTDLENVQLDVLKYRMDRAKLNDGSYNLSILPTPLEFALVGWDPEKDPEKGKWLGKTVMMDTGWSGVKHLSPKAREQIQAINYNQIKNARKRVLSKQNMPSVSSQGLSVIESDEFRNDGVISPYYSQIKDALRNNRSLAVLSVDAKNALNDYVSRQMLNKNRSLSLDDVFRLRDGLSNEYRADHGYSDPFNSANVLSEFTVDDFSAAASGGTSKIAEAGFEVKRLNGLGVNDQYGMFEVTHIASGQKFYVKNDEYAADYSETPAGITELEASIIFRAAGMQGIHDVRAAKNQQNLVVMSEAGSNVPLVSRAVNAGPGARNGIPDASGTITRLQYDPQKFVELLDNPEDIIRMSIFDILSNNVDRHDGNYMIAFDKSTGKLRVFPVDNTLGEIKKDETRIEDFLIDSDSFAGSDAYQNYMPILINKIGTGDLLKIYRHQIKNITDNLSNPLYQPKGFEMDKIIEKWGTYDAFKDAVSSRLNNLISKNSQEYKALENALRLGYWN